MNIIETFVGCGGSHIGFKRQGFKTIFVNDIWDTALETLKYNNKELTDDMIICEDINTLCNKDLLTQFNIKKNDLDVLIGGVVCKGFSTAGVRNPYDDRNYLYISQLKLVEKFKPKISIIENVPGMKNMKILCKENIAPISNKLKNSITEPNLDICNYINENIKNIKLNTGSIFSINRKIELKRTDELLKQKEDLYIQKQNLLHQRNQLQKKLDNSLFSVLDDITEKYYELGYKVYIKKIKVSDIGGYTSRTRLIIVAIRNDIKKDWIWDDYNKPLKTVGDAFNLLDDNINNPKIDNDNIPMKHTKKTIEKFKNIDNLNFGGRLKKINIKKACHTIVPGHSNLPLHPLENRLITIREAATISGFPIDYKFFGSHSNKCIQVGNAIPVQLGEYLAINCKKFLS